MDFVVGSLESPYDRLIGTPNADVINFFAPDSSLQSLISQAQASSFVDKIEGLNGNDLIIDNNVSRFLLGGAGNDTLRGNGGNDLLNGDEGNDLLVGGKATTVYQEILVPIP